MSEAPRRKSLPRSFLYVPANKPALIDKAATGPADAIVLDLEDAVPLAEKSVAREAVREHLTANRSIGPGPQRWVRIDPDAWREDLDASVHAGLSGLFVAKCTAGSLATIADELSRLETARGMAPGSTLVIGLIESAHTWHHLSELTANPRLTTLGVGEVDLLADLRIARTPSTAGVIDTLRLEIVVACAAAGLSAPVAPTSTDFRDLEAFATTGRELAERGFRSRTAIHPAQIPVIHEVLTPSADEIARAAAILERFTSAGNGVTTDASGRLIDAAVVRSAHETLDQADAARVRGM